MAAPIPENSWIFILIMAVIILALLWNDGISSSSSSSSSKGGSSSGDSDTGDDGNSGDEGSGSDSNVGMDPVIRVEEQVDDLNTTVKLTVEAFSRSNADIVATGIEKMVHGPSGRDYVEADSPENSNYINRGSEYVFEESGLAVGPWQYQAWAEDSEGRTNTYVNGFNIEAHGPDDPVEDPTDDFTRYVEVYLEYIDDLQKLYNFAKSEIDNGQRRILIIMNQFWNEVISGNIELDHEIEDLFLKSRYLSDNFSGAKNFLEQRNFPDNIDFNRRSIDELEILLRGFDDLDKGVDSEKFSN